MKDTPEKSHNKNQSRTGNHGNNGKYFNYFSGFEYLNELVMVLSNEGKLLYINGHSIERLGYVQDELAGKDFTDLVSKKISPGINLNMNELKNDSKLARNILLLSKRGETFKVEFKLSQVKIGDELLLIMMGREIEERQQMNEFLLNERNQLRILIDALPDAVYFKDNYCRYIIANNAVKERINLHHDEVVIGKTDYDYYASDKADKLFKKDQEVVKKGEPLLNIEETFFNPRTKKDCYCITTRVPLRDKNHDVIGLIGISRDITELKETEKKLHIQQASLNALIENTRNAIWSIDKDYQLIHINTYFKESFKKHFEVDLEIGANALGILSGKEQQEWKTIYDRALSGEQWIEEHSYVTHGKRVYFEVLISPITSEEGETTGATFLSHNITERKEYENELLKSRAQLKALLDNIPHLAWLKDGDGRYVMVNRPFADYYQKKPRELISKKDVDFLPEEQAERYIGEDKKVMSNKQQLLFEEHYAPKGENPRWTETIKTPILNDQNEIIGITGISRDITERKELEKRIKSSEEHFRSLLQNSTDAITILDKSGHITFESSLEGKLSKLDFEELKGKSIFELIHPDDQENVRMIFKNSIKNPGRQYKVEFRGWQKNDSWIYIESIFANNLENPLIKGIVMNSRDVSERKLADKREEEFKDKLFYLSLTALEFLSISINEDIFSYIGKKIVELIKDSIVIVSTYDETESKFRVKHVSGIEDNENKFLQLTGKSILDFTIPVETTFRMELMKNVKELYHYKGGVYEAVNYHIDKDLSLEIERVFNLNHVFGIALMRGGKLYGRVLITTLGGNTINDTKLIETFIYQASIALHRKQLENELIKAKEKAEESDKLKSAFLANMSHEIRTPMNSILGFSQLLNDDNLSPRLREEYSEIINNNGKVLTNLINDIIDISKIEAGQISLRKEIVSLESILKELHSFYNSNTDFIQKEEVALKLNYSLPADVNILSDSVRLRQVLTNLIGNAIKFTDSGYIEFGCKLKNKDTLLFFVIDTGIGFSKSKQEVIFDRFTQVDHTSTRRYGGSGLGLAISRGLVELLGGRIWAQSEPDKGSKLYFTLPYTKTLKEEKREYQKSNVRKTYNWEDKTLLIVEDEKLNLRYLHEVLRKTNVKIIPAENGLEAVDAYRENKEIDLILMDLQLPEMSGYDAVKEIRKFDTSVPIVAQTANAMEEDRQRCMEIGFDEYITKPIVVDYLFSTIEKYFGDSTRDINV